jgi:hypothetical protein
VAKRKKKQRNYFEGSFDAQIVESWIIERITQNATSLEQRKGTIFVSTLITY